jgi:molybdate transport repressor ModE-like protein
MDKPRPAYKIWLETDDGFVFGPGVDALLRKVKEKGTLKEAASSLDMSYRYAWGLIKKVEKKLGEPLIEAYKGGRSGGGRTEITKLGHQFIDDFRILKEKFSKQIIENNGSQSSWIKAEIVSIKKHSDHMEIKMRSEPKLVSNIRVKEEELDSKLGIGDKIKLELRKF